MPDALTPDAMLLAQKILSWLINHNAELGLPRASGERPLFVIDGRQKRTILIVPETLLNRMVTRKWLKDGKAGIFVTAAGKRWHNGKDKVPSVGTVPEPRTRCESPLDWLKSRKGPDGQLLISTDQYEAGNRLRRDFEQAGLGPRMGINWSAVRVDSSRSGGDGSSAQLDAGQRFRAAIESAGPELADPLIDICCFLTGLEDVEKAHNWPRRSGRIVLKIGLSRLSRHYGLSNSRARV